MPRQFIQLEAFTREERHEMTTRAEGAIASAGGWLVDAQLASNLAAVLLFELPLSGVTALRDALHASGLHLTDTSTTALAGLCDAVLTRPPMASDELAGTLRLAFIHNEKDLRRVVPAVPG